MHPDNDRNTSYGFTYDSNAKESFSEQLQAWIDLLDAIHNMSGIPPPPPSPPHVDTSGNQTPPETDTNAISPTTQLRDAITRIAEQSAAAVTGQSVPAAPRVSYRNLPRFELPKFDPKVYEPEDYIKEFERECALYNYGDDLRRQLLARAVREAGGKYVSWFMEEGAEIFHYKDFKDAFVDAFHTTGRAAVLRTERTWKKTRQRKDDVRTYAATFSRRLRLHNNARLSAGYKDVEDHVVVDQWCDGLEAPEMKKYVLMANPSDLENAKKLSLDYEKKVYSRDKRSSDNDEESSSSSSSEEDEVTETVRKETKGKGKTTTIVTTKAKSPSNSEGLDKKLLNEMKKAMESQQKSLETQAKALQETLANEAKKQREQAADDLAQEFSKMRIQMAVPRTFNGGGASAQGYAPNPGYNPGIGGAPQNANDAQGQGQGQGRRPIVCFRCQSTDGHIMRNCRNPPVCRICGGNHLTLQHDMHIKLVTLQEFVDKKTEKKDF